MTARKMNSAPRFNEGIGTFTIVTPNYNMGSYLASTIESVLRNLGPGDEYFIIDGGSSDNSAEVIRSFEPKLTGWVSEPDSGYADAVAKGFRLAGGQYLCWVNSGDVMLDGALGRARLSLQQTGADLIFGDDLLIDEEDKVMQVTNGHATNLMAMMLYAGWTPLQESCFWTRALYEKVGGIDPTVKYAADYDLFLRMSLIGYCHYLEAIFGAFRRHNGQLSMVKTALYKAEREKCRTRELGTLASSVRLPLIHFYYWFKIRWRVRVHAKKRNMNHLQGNSVHDVACQDSWNSDGVKPGIKHLLRNLTMMAIHPRPLIGLVYLPRFISHWIKFSRINKGKRLRLVDAHPNLYDWVSSTPFDPHYFYQAAWLARQLADNPPEKHIDIGSDVKLIAILSAFVQTEFLDYRPLDVALSGLKCSRGNVLTLHMDGDSVDSLSCLHVVEHIGLGRYGDPIDPEGSHKALTELQRVIKPGGRLYLSVPVGQPRVCFNAHRVFTPESIVTMLPYMRVASFSLVGDDGRFHPECRPSDAKKLNYGCGMFVMEKQSAGHPK